jgi:putative transposase
MVTIFKNRAGTSFESFNSLILRAIILLCHIIGMHPFKTCKQQPDYPARFSGVDHARAWFAEYAQWYNFSHQHSGLAYFTPHQVFTGQVEEVAARRQTALHAAYTANPKRFINGSPMVKLPPQEVWINPAHPDDAADTIAVNFPTLTVAKKIVL